MRKVLIIILISICKCFGQNTIYPEDASTFATTITDEDGTTIDPKELLQELKNERSQIQSKQATNVTQPVSTVSPASTVSNVTNQVTTTVSNAYNRIPCSCVKGQCGCCTGALLAYLNQKACLNITYEPEEFAFNAALSLNDREFFKRRISGKNPPPICIRVPRIRAIQLCARFSNVYFTGPNMHACVGMEANWDDFTLFQTLFNCFRIGGAGVAIVPPEDGGGLGSSTDEDDDEDDDDDDYDDNARGFGFGRFRNKLK